jgi:hypothetical protein
MKISIQYKVSADSWDEDIHFCEAATWMDVANAIQTLEAAGHVVFSVDRNDIQSRNSP